MIDFCKGVAIIFTINLKNRNLFYCFFLLIALCCIPVSFAQQTYSVTVKDASGVPLPGVNVIVK